MAAIATLFGITTSLGLGAQQINEGLHLLNSDVPVTNGAQTVIIWIVTAVATVSVVSGIYVGIRRLSEVTFLLAHFILTFTLLVGDTWLYLNTFVQSVGFFVWRFFELASNTQSWQLHSHYDAPGGIHGPSDWMNTWCGFDLFLQNLVTLPCPRISSPPFTFLNTCRSRTFLSNDALPLSSLFLSLSLLRWWVTGLLGFYEGSVLLRMVGFMVLLRGTVHSAHIARQNYP